MASILYVGTEEGVVTLKRENGGPCRIESHGLREWSVPELAVVPSAPNKVLAATRGDGVWLSEDFGRSWTKPCYGRRGPGKVRCLALDPMDAQVVYAGCEPIDLYVSGNLGKTWERLDSVRQFPGVEEVGYPVPTVEPHVRDIVIDPEDPKEIYIALQVGYILKSADGGVTWRRLDKDLDADVHTIVMDPTNTNRLFISTGGEYSRQGKALGRALYRSRDGGETWEALAMEFSQEYSFPLAMHPRNPRVLVAAIAKGSPSTWRRPTGAESIVIRTKDGGTTWEKLESGLAEVSNGFPWAIIYDDQNPDRLYAGLRTGELYVSEEGGDYWSKLDIKLSSVSDMKGVHV